jgi:hypothetical protein
LLCGGGGRRREGEGDIKIDENRRREEKVEGMDG